MTLVWRPSRVFAAAAAICLLTMIVLTAHPAEMWLRLGRLNEDMIYRLLFCTLLGSFGTVLVSATVLTDALHELIDDQPRPRTFVSVLLDRLYTLKSLAILTAAALPVLAWLVGAGVRTLITAGEVHIHWSRVVLAGLLAFALAQMLVTTLITNVVRFHTPRRKIRVLERKSAILRTIPTADFLPQPSSGQALITPMSPKVPAASV